MQDSFTTQTGPNASVRSPLWCLVLLIACVVVMFAARLLAPSALQRFDQPRTASYTADVVVNGRWLLPRDMLGHTATKPPLVNWLAAPVVALGFWTEWAVKWPMAAGALMSAALTVWIARRLFRQMPEIGDHAKNAATIAGIAWLVNPANLTMIYHCRPDPLLVTFLTAAWILGTIIVCDKEAPSLFVVLGFWIAVGLVALTKGPAAMVPIFYLPLAARLCRMCRRSCVRNWFRKFRRSALFSVCIGSKRSAHVCNPLRTQRG